MFYNKLKTDPVAEAVKKILEGTEKKRMINDGDLDETGFHKAAHAAKKANQSHFEFQGKKYPVTAKSHKEAIEMEEGFDDMEKYLKDKNKPQPSGGAGKKQGSKYGGGKQKDEPAKDMKEDADCVTAPQAKKIAKKEVGHHNVTMHKGQKSTVKEDSSFKDRLLEREMTSAETKKKEKIVMSMKDKTDYFKKKYGTRWKEVMYATATKQAMGEETKPAVVKTNKPIGTRVADIGPGGKEYNVKTNKEWDKQKKMKEAFELQEKNESHTHAAHYENEKGEWTGMNLFVAKDDEDAIRQAHQKCKDGCRLSRVERHTPIKEDVEQIDEVSTISHQASADSDTATDMLRGRVQGVAKSNDFKSFKVKIEGDGIKRPNPEDDEPSLSSTPARASRVTHSPEVEIKPGAVVGEGKDPMMDAGVGSQPDFAKGENTTSSPVSRAKDIAKRALHRVKTETLGKIGNQ
jgi:hypothetical protein